MAGQAAISMGAATLGEAVAVSAKLLFYRHKYRKPDYDELSSWNALSRLCGAAGDERAAGRRD